METILSGTKEVVDTLFYISNKTCLLGVNQICRMLELYDFS